MFAFAIKGNLHPSLVASGRERNFTRPYRT